MKFLAQLVVSALAVIVTSLLLHDVKIDSPLTGILVAAVLAVLNTFLKPLLIVLTIPFTVVTFGLFLLVINAAIILLVSHIVPGFYVGGFWTAFFFSIILSLISSLFNKLGEKNNKEN
jgi:putative membrane protein